MNGWEPACYTITRRSGLPRNAHLHAHIYREVAQFLKTTDFVDFDLHRSDGPKRPMATTNAAIQNSMQQLAALPFTRILKILRKNLSGWPIEKNFEKLQP